MAVALKGLTLEAFLVLPEQEPVTRIFRWGGDAENATNG